MVQQAVLAAGFLPPYFASDEQAARSIPNLEKSLIQVAVSKHNFTPEQAVGFARDYVHTLRNPSK